VTATLGAGAGVAAEPEAVAGPPVGLYVHIPFCISICPYCDFVVVAGAAARGPRNRIASFVAALRAEISLRADALDDRFGADRPALDTLYLGGGTPSLVPAQTVAGLVEMVRERFGLAPRAEVTLEANPGPDDRGELGGFGDAGVTRVSFGAQSLDPVELHRLGRRHAPEDVAEAVRRARAAGMASVNLDLLYDVPGQTVASFAASLDAALELDPDHLSIYGLTLDDPTAEGLTGPLGDHLPTTPGARRWRERAAIEQDDDRAADQYRHAVDRLAAAGFEGYEISNWAQPRHRSRHNLAYWRRLPYEAVGPGAHAFDGTVRRWNAARLDAYVAALTPDDGDRPRLPPGGSERIDAATAAAERVILGLRTSDGVPAATADDPRFAKALEWARKAGLLSAAADDGDRLVLTVTGRLLSNEVFARFV
jgi:oxygen-independent coproporphyrinogen-3 oxidase